MYLLVIFNDKSIAIVGESQIEKANRKSTKTPTPGDKVNVIKGSMLGMAKVVHVSSNKAYLQKSIPLINKDDGTLVKNGKGKSQNNISNKKPRKEVSNAALITKAARSQTTKQLNEIFTLPSSNVEPSHKILDEASCSTTNVNQELVDTNPTTTSNVLEFVSVSTLDSHEGQGNGEISTGNVPIPSTSTDDQGIGPDTGDSEESDSDCSSIMDNPKVKRAVKELYSVMRREMKKEKRSGNKSKLGKTKDTGKPQWQEEDVGKERLVEGYDVWIYSAALVAIEATANNSVAALFRGLLKHFMGEELAELSSKTIPEDVREASLAYAKMNGVTPMKGLASKVANNLCGSMKRSMSTNKSASKRNKLVPTDRKIQQVVEIVDAYEETVTPLHVNWNNVQIIESPEIRPSTILSSSNDIVGENKINVSTDATTQIQGDLKNVQMENNPELSPSMMSSFPDDIDSIRESMIVISQD